MMNRYSFKVYETVVHTYETIAEDEESAFENVEQAYLNGELNEFLTKKVDKRTQENNFEGGIIMEENVELTMDEVAELSFDEAYNYLQEKDLGNWDDVNSEETIRQYIAEKSAEGIRVNHILEALENNPSDKELYAIWLGNSMETPTPINTVKDLLEALGFKKNYIYELYYNDEKVDQTSLDELNENLAWDTMIEDHKSKDGNLLSVKLIKTTWEED